MSWTPISNTPPQYEENGIAASGYYIKFYVAGTTTPTAMATDFTGGTLLDKCQLNSKGYPVNGSSAVFLPHINIKYKIALFRNEADADSNNLANAAWEVDDLFPFFTDASIGTGFGQIPLNTDIVYPVANVTALRALTGIQVGQSFYLKGHTNDGIGNGDLLATTAYTAEIDDNGTLFVVDGIVIERPDAGFVTPEMFGGGIGGDDTASINAADQHTGSSSVVLNAASYSVTQVAQTKTWSQNEGSWLVFNGSAGNVIVTNTGSNVSGNLNIDGNGLSPRTMLKTDTASSGANYGIINLKNAVASGAIGSQLVVGWEDNGTSNKCESLITTDLTNTGHVNDSLPQSFATAPTSLNPHVGSVYAKDCTSGVVSNHSAGIATIGTVTTKNISDNGIYNTQGAVVVGTLTYNGSDEPLVCQADMTLGALIIEKAGNSAIGIQNATNVQIGQVLLGVNTGVNAIVKTRVGNTAAGQVYIGQVMGEFTGDTLWNLTVGTVDYFTVKNVSVVYNYDNTATGSLDQWGRLSVCAGHDIRNVKVDIIDSTNNLPASSVFNMQARIGEPDLQSFAYDIDIDVFGQDRSTISPNGSVRLQQFAKANTQTSGFRWFSTTGPRGQGVSFGPRNAANNAPTVGIWRVGEQFSNRIPAVGQPKGWICTVAGEPGTWVSLGNL